MRDRMTIRTWLAHSRRSRVSRGGGCDPPDVKPPADVSYVLAMERLANAEGEPPEMFDELWVATGSTGMKHLHAPEPNSR